MNKLHAAYSYVVDYLISVYWQVRRNRLRTLGFIAGALIILFAVLSFAASSSKLTKSQAATVAGCEHSAVLIAQVNRSGAALYSLASLVARGPLPKPFAKKINALAKAQSWIPLTPCASAVTAHGSYYKLQPAVRFSKRLPPKAELQPPTSGIQR